MITISLWQPWATAMFVRRPNMPGMLKGFETRSWQPSEKLLPPGQRLGIHAAKTQVDQDGEQLRDWWLRKVKNTEMGVAFAAAGFNDWCDLPFGAVIGHGVFVGAFNTERLMQNDAIDSCEEFWGNYGPKRFCWQMQGMIAFDEPFAFRGKQSLFESQPPVPETAPNRPELWDDKEIAR